MNDQHIILNPNFEQKRGKINSVLFDFDGTLSLLREGWEGIMAPMMLEMICPGMDPPTEIEQEVKEYIDQSTGILTIRQMEWLAQAVQRYGYSKSVKTPGEYKKIYVQQIRQKVETRVTRLVNGQVTADELVVPGSFEFVSRLSEIGIRLYLASGTDHEDVVRESGILGLDRYFAPHIYGALDASESNDKERIIRRILAENDLEGNELLVVGDGPVEIRVAVANGAIALGAATEEVSRNGWNFRKIERLKRAGADLLIPDFERTDFLLQLFGLVN
jgi:phosphoglycolate phosphatase-like HAD superfamily hydrolase